MVRSADVAETAALFANGQTLQHPQPPTPLKTDNATANSFVHNNIHQRKIKSWDMRFIS